MINYFLIREKTNDFYLISLFLSSVILFSLSILFNGFLSYILSLGGFGYGIGFSYLLMKDARESKTKWLEILSIAVLIPLIIFFVYFLFIPTKSDIFSLIAGLIIILIPVLLMNSKKFFPIVIPLSLKLTPSFGNNYLIELIKAHPAISIAVGIVAIYIFFKMIKDIVKIIILTVVVWVILKFLLGL